MSVTFTHTASEVAAVRSAVDLWAVDSVDAAQLAAVKIAARWQSEGATAADIASVLSTVDKAYSTRQVDAPLAHMVRLSALVKSDEDVTGVTACGVLLSGRGTGRSVNGPAKVLKDWTKAGKTFSTWESARKALAALVKAAPAKVDKGTADKGTDTDKGTAKVEPAKVETLDTASERIATELLATAGRLGIAPAALLASVAKVTTAKVTAPLDKGAPVKATPATVGKPAPAVKAAA